jgi:hypothetical protein
MIYLKVVIKKKIEIMEYKKYLKKILLINLVLILIKKNILP